MSTEAIKVGVFGAGIMGSIHAGWLSRIDGIKIGGIMDVDLGKAKALKEKVHADYVTDQADDIMNDKQISAVLICTHHDSHAPLALRSAEAKKRIFMEKPLAMTEKDCYQVKEALEKNGTDIFMGFIRRFSSIGMRAKELIQSPKVVFGQIMEAPWGYNHWAQNPRTGGGNVISQGCHLFDLVCWYAGSDPVEVSAKGGELTHQGTGIIDNMACNIQFANGVLGNIVAGDSGVPKIVQKFFLEILCGESAVSINGFQDLYCSGLNQEDIHLAEPDRGDQRQMETFADCLKNKKAFPCGIREGIIGTVMVLKAFESIQMGKTVKLDFSNL